MPSHTSIFTGLYPSAHGLNWNHLFLSGRFTTMAELFRRNGYDTIGFCNNAWVNRENGLAQGFDTYLEMWRKDRLNPTFYHWLEWFVQRLLGRDDHGALRTRQWVEEWFEQHPDPRSSFFMFINLMECHLWHDAPDAYHEMFLREGYSRRVKCTYGRGLGSLLTGKLSLTDDEWRDFGGIHDGDLRYTDEILGQLLRFLDDRGDLENTIVVITADHGEHLGKHPMASTGPSGRSTSSPR